MGWPFGNITYGESTTPICWLCFYDGLKIWLDSGRIGLLRAVEDLINSKQHVYVCASAVITSVKYVLLHPLKQLVLNKIGAHHYF